LVRVVVVVVASVWKKAMQYFSHNQKDALISYQYKGVDNSPIYQHILSPLAQFCVDTFVPNSVAPNVITLLGLLCTVFAALLTLYYDPFLVGDAPRWVHLTTGVCVFAYQTLDNMDGKQARKTNSASALGMLFDHSCDALNTVVTSIAMSSAMAMGWSNKMLYFFLVGYVPFYFQTWEEYYVGAMALPIFNGPTEGLLMVSGICVLSYINGAHWFQQETDLLHNEWTMLVFGKKFTPFDFIFAMGYVMCFCTIVDQTKAGLHYPKLVAYSIFFCDCICLVVIRVTLQRGQSVWKPFYNLMPILLHTFFSLYWINRDQYVWQDYPLQAV
jgi:phosphatidylglycerophosphate synthase